MADVYVDSNAAGTASGADWANACLTLNAGFTAASAGDTIYVAHNHAETQASAMTITAKGTQASPCRVICVNSAGSVPPVSADLATTATVTTTGANSLTISGAAFCYFEGIAFNAATGANTSAMSVNGTSNAAMIFKNCAFNKNSTSGNANGINFGSGGRNTTVLVNCTLGYGNTGDSSIVSGNFIWRDTPSAITGSVPTTIFKDNNNERYYVIEGVDLSALGSGATLFAALQTGNSAVLKDCKLGASVTVASAPSGPYTNIDVVRCDSGDTNYRTERYAYQGTLTTETTTVRTGGASDGTTTIAWKIVPTANNERDFPFECFPISIWNETTGSAVTLTIEGTWGGGAVPTTADIWMDVEYLGTSGNPLGDTIYGGPADVLAAGTNHTSSSETWGAGGTTKFKMAVSVTPQEKGPITVYIKYAHTTNTVWIDPKITVS